MEGCVVVPVVMFFMVLAVVIAVAGSRAQQRFESAMEAAAQELGGTFEKAAFLSRPRAKLSFQVQGRAAEITFKQSSKNSPAATTVAIDVYGVSPGALKIYPEGFGSSIAKFFGAQDIRIGDPGFDGLYIIKSMPESLAHHVFREEQRAKIIHLVRRIGMRSDPLIDLSRSQLVVRVGELLNEAATVVDLARAAEGLYGLLCGGGASASVRGWVAEASASAAGAQCQVCGAAMENDIVYCVKCRTPHHKDCWEYNAGCSTFACGCKQHTGA